MNDTTIVHIWNPSTDDIWAIFDWLEENAKHGYNTRVIDVSDTSMLYDILFEVEFNDAQDAMLFSLTWR